MQIGKSSLCALVASLMLVCACGVAGGAEEKLRESPETVEPGGEEPPAPPAEAEKEDKKPKEDKPPPTPRRDGGWPAWMLPVLLLGAFVLMYVFMGRSRRRQERKRRDMLASLQKGDKVVTIGGIVGTIMDVRKDEIMVKVDETSNTRMRFARWAVRGVGEELKGEEAEARK
jgi:preprotein translocase subunit YajC